MMGWLSQFALLQLLGALILPAATNLTVSLGETEQENHLQTPPTQPINLFMPDYRPVKKDDYVCTGVEVGSLNTTFIRTFEPHSNQERAHHMLLFACDQLPDALANNKNGQKWWSCGHHTQVCNKTRIIYAWAKNAPTMELPKNVGFRIGPEANVMHLVLQVHYTQPLQPGLTDQSGFRLEISTKEPEYIAGMLILFKTTLDIPPQTPRIESKMNCLVKLNSSIHVFAYRLHTHKLGTQVAGYRFNPATTQLQLIGKGSPQIPEAFYSTEGEGVTVNPGEYLLAECIFSSVGLDHSTQIGMTAQDEMCIFYAMYYTRSRNYQDHSIACFDEENVEVSRYLPTERQLSYEQPVQKLRRTMPENWEEFARVGLMIMAFLASPLLVVALIGFIRKSFAYRGDEWAFRRRRNYPGNLLPTRAGFQRLGTHEVLDDLIEEDEDDE